MIAQDVDSVNEGQSLRDAASKYGIAKSTLYDKLKNYSPIGCRKGPPTVLTKSE